MRIEQWGSSEDSSSENASLNVVVAAKYVDDEQLAEYATEFGKTYDTEINWVAVTTGDSEADPMSTVAGMTKLSGMMVDGQIDVLITDLENALRHGDNGDTYLKLSDVFDGNDITEFKRPLIKLPIRYDEGNETGEETATLGIDISDNSEIMKVASGEEFGAFIVVNAANMENAKALIEHLATKKTYKHTNMPCSCLCVLIKCSNKYTYNHHNDYEYTY